MPSRTPRTKKAKKAAMRQTMREFKTGKLKSGSGAKVTNPKQAIAIGLKESNQSNRKSSARRKKLEKVTL